MTEPTEFSLSAYASIEDALRQAVAWQHSGSPQRAEEIYQQILYSKPDHAEALHLLSTVRHAQGRYQEALVLVERAIAASPDRSFYHNTRGCILLALQFYQEALPEFQHAASLDSTNANAFVNLGQTLALTGRFPEALRAFDQALRIKPTFPESAAAAGRLLRATGDTRKAIPYLQRAVELAPHNLDFIEDLAVALLLLGQTNAATERFEALLQLEPDRITSRISLAYCYLSNNKASKAVTLLQKGREYPGSQNPLILDALYQSHRYACDWGNLTSLEQECTSCIRSRLTANQAPGFEGFTVLYLPVSACEIKKNNEWLSKASSGHEPLRQARQYQPISRLRIGYATANIKDHPTTHLIADLFRNHDRRRFEIFLYSWSNNDHSPYRRKIESEVEHFIDCHQMTDKELAERVAIDKIDILVDLVGHTTNRRLGLTARRPAPIQINYQGYPGTSGSPFIDYIIADPRTAPNGTEDEFSEALIRLPITYQVNSHRSVELGPRPSRSALGLPETGPVLCAMHNSFKIEPFVFNIWCRLLRQVPDSVLWLLSKAEAVDSNLRREAARRGVASERLVFAQRAPRREHLTRLQIADLYLDTRFYNAHTTSADALWAGVPVLTTKGDRFSGRVTGSLLYAIGLPELIMPDWDAYEAEALRLVTNPDALAALKARLGTTATRATTPLFDTRARVRELERAYEMAWRRHQAGQAPEAFDVPRGDTSDRRYSSADFPEESKSGPLEE